MGERMNEEENFLTPLMPSRSFFSTFPPISVLSLPCDLRRTLPELSPFPTSREDEGGGEEEEEGLSEGGVVALLR